MRRIELRKKRILDYSWGGPSYDPEENEPVVDEDVEDDQPKESISGTTTYDNGDIQVTVTTSEISRKEEAHLASQKQQPEPAAPVEELTKKLKTAAKMKPTKKPFKRVSKNKSSKSRNKRDKSKAGKRNKKGR